MYVRVALFVVAVLILAGVAIADVPRLITFQGRLTDDADVPVADGDYEIEFFIFPDSTGLSSMWSEVQVVTVTDGLFDVCLGRITPLDPFIFDDHVDLFLGMWLYNTRDEFLPRVRLVANAFSYVALHADTAEFAHATLGTGWIDGGSVVRLESDIDSVGIGTNTPAEKLEVDGNLRLTGKVNIGPGNTNSGVNASVAGQLNTAAGAWSTITGGMLNTASENFSAISGGMSNIADAEFSITGGGCHNYARGIYSVVGGGGGPTQADSNSALGEYSAVSGGRRNIAVGDRSSVGGGYGNVADGSHARIGGGRLHMIVGDYATVAGGIKDTVLGNYTTVGGGANNRASANYGTIAGGNGNDIFGSAYVTVGGGCENQASGECATIPGGYGCHADGAYAFAAGYRAWANTQGSFVWADNNPFYLETGALSKVFKARSTGGVFFITGIDGTGATTSGARLSTGSSTWSSLCDRNIKENFAPVNGTEILDRLAAMSVNTWNYIAEGDSIRHIGPVAQDFYSAFGLGEDDRHITTVDADGVALAAIQGLYQQNQEQQKRIEELESLVKELLQDRQ